jgi:hypothetical protein
MLGGCLQKWVKFEGLVKLSLYFFKGSFGHFILLHGQRSFCLNY